MNNSSSSVNADRDSADKTDRPFRSLFKFCHVHVRGISKFDTFQSSVFF